MFVNNPFAQAGWSNTSNSNSTNSGTSSPAPSILGALPYFSPSSQSSTLTFYFTSLNPTILNCTVVGPQSRPYFYVITDSRFTTFQNVERKTIAIVEWDSHPFIEMEGVIPKQRIARWLGLSPNQSCRLMEVNGKRYTWAPDGNFICLDEAGLTPSKVLARISAARGHRTYTLEITTEAIQLGMLGVSIIVTVLLQSGRNID